MRTSPGFLQRCFADRINVCMADYILDEETGSNIALETAPGYILLEESLGPEGWEYVEQRTSIWVYVPRVTT